MKTDFLSAVALSGIPAVQSQINRLREMEDFEAKERGLNEALEKAGITREEYEIANAASLWRPDPDIITQLSGLIQPGKPSRKRHNRKHIVR